MSKYDDLWRTYNEERRNHTEYKNACVRFAADLFAGFIDYIGCPKDRILFFPLDRNQEGQPTPMYAASMGDDGRVVTVALIELGPPPEPTVIQIGGTVSLQVPTYFSREGDQFTVQAAKGSPFTLRSADEPKAMEFFEDLVQQIKQHLRDSYTLPVVPRMIGFHRGS